MRRLANIDALTGPGAFRLFLAMVVVVHHATSLALGKAAVEVFFYLSGFWIYRMWTERYARTAAPVATYLASRVWRLIPTFALVSMATLAWEHLGLGWSWARLEGGANPLHFTISHLLILGYNTLPVQPLRPAWSLDVELQFYLVAPLMILAIQQLGAPLLVSGAAAVSAVCVVAFGPRASPDFLVCFALGLAAAHVDWRPSARLAVSCGSGLVLFLLVLALSPWRGMLMGGLHRSPLFRYSEAVNALVALMATPYAAYTTRQRGGRRDAMLGDLSYIVYLLHWMGVVWLATQSGHSPMVRLLLIAAMASATLAGAWVIWRLYDKPLNRLRSRWVAARVGSRPAGVSVEPAAP